jgi:hypothetical protein
MIQPHSKDEVLRRASELDIIARAFADDPMVSKHHADTAAMLRAYAEVVDGWRPIETADKGVMVVVYWNEDGEDLYDFDVLDEDDGWINHSACYANYLSVAPPGSRGPSEKPPYTHWRPISPPLTAALSTRGGDVNHTE